MLEAGVLDGGLVRRVEGGDRVEEKRQGEKEDFMLGLDTPPSSVLLGPAVLFPKIFTSVFIRKY